MEKSKDGSDGKNLGCGTAIQDRPDAPMPVGRTDPDYNMRHKERGHALVLAYENFSSSGPPRRSCAEHDVHIVTKAFKKLNFVVTTHWDLRKEKFLATLKQESERDHSDHDCLAVVVMSHGGVNNNKEEFIWTYDNKVDTTELWKNFTPEKCPSLAGKPKLFFIQACRGENVDKGVRLQRPRGLQVQTDSLPIERDYAIPLYADMLMMWASYPGMFAFKSGNNGINGSVFLHFLSKVLTEDGDQHDLSSMLLRVTREVAIVYESYVPGNFDLDKNKQIPYTVSTLMRKVFFNPK
ncbi:caspase-1-like [Penaeus japonicus]|uniref:caspase-1-like n=1 Tax=Penaeus japonicus TaxID=27405 RepID=UPI001C7116DE|nr:caspase-1-like [Penaeus japonicus]